ncbi:MAG TPA: polysaccharide deacetylase family protein [Blastocatellia bacterium]|nr:polysaccharide deacetylase family protein [Blastocatellia bacterium]
MKEQKPTASLSLDLDNQWSYQKTHGDTGWETFPSYLNIVVPRVLEFLKERGLRITFFIVGQDAALEKNAEALRALAAAGHEIGNHSFHHEPWLHLYSEAEIEAEIANAEEQIERVTGQRPRGFRGPGFSLSASTLRVLERRGYIYDASTFPTFLGPLARAYYFMTAKLSREEMRRRKALFGTFSEGWRPLKPYRWGIGGEESLIEIPVTTLPVFKVPMHASYVLYLSSFSTALALLYFKTAVKLCRLTGTQLSLLLHPLDFLGAEDVRELAFFPGMNLASEKKLAVMSEIIGILSKEFSVVTMQQHAALASSSPKLQLVEPRFNQGELPLRLMETER